MNTENQINAEAIRKVDPAQVEVVGEEQPRARPAFGDGPAFMTSNFKVMKGSPWALLLIPVIIPIFLVMFLFLSVFAMIFGRSIFKVIRYGQAQKS